MTAMSSAFFDPNTVVPKRALVLCAAGAVIGLLIAGFGLFTSSGTRTGVVPPDDVAVVNGVPILMSDYTALLSATYSVPLDKATPQQKKTVLDSMIREELYVQRGIELGMQTDVIEVRGALVQAVEAQQTADVIAAGFSDAELNAYYLAHRSSYATEGQIFLDDYIAPDAVTANAGAAALKAGEPPKGLTKTALFSDGTEFYFAAKIHLGDALFANAVRLSAGMVSDPIQAPDGYHVLMMHLNTPPQSLPFDSVKDRVLKDMRDSETQRLSGSSLTYLRKRADILIAEGFK